MKNTFQTICLFSSLGLLGLSPNAFGNPQSNQGIQPEESLAISEPARPIIGTIPVTKYSMRFVKPSTEYECKIIYVTPDPSINYTIRNVRPDLDNPLLRNNGWPNGTGGKNSPRE